MRLKAAHIAIAGAIAARLAVAIIPGDRLDAPWSGGGDNYQYIGIARNLVAGRGYTFAGQPTAFRAPAYPILIAGLMHFHHWPLLLRLLQFAASLGIAFLCASLARRWRGNGTLAFALALILPTLIFSQGEIMTECFASLFIIWFLVLVDRQQYMSAGLMSGLAALTRFNAIPLLPFAVAIAVYRAGWKRAAGVALAGALVLAPWIAHNEKAFKGQASYSTHGGYDAVEGVLMPIGRAQPGETESLKRYLPWGNQDVETDNPKPGMRDEPALNRQAWGVAQGLWLEKFWQLPSIAIRKLGAFWLSYDQLADTHSLGWRARVVRIAGVLIYLVVLGMAFYGWMELRKRDIFAANYVLAFVVLLTFLHLPLTMNTRLRSPLFDPLICVLASVGRTVSKSTQFT